jgi:hypothetical protein
MSDSRTVDVERELARCDLLIRERWPTMTVNVVEYQQVLAAYRELDSYKVMVACVHRACDEAGFPKPPENEPGIPWRVLQMLRELSALRQRVGELENMLADYGDETVVSDGWPAAQNRVLAEADNLAAARQAGEGRE